MSKQHDAAIGFVSRASEDDMPDSGSTLTRELGRVEEANLAFYQAFTARDLDAMSKVWSPSPHARCVHPGWELVVGHEDIRNSWSEIFTTVHNIEFQLEDTHIEVTGRTAWVNLIAFVQLTTDEGDTFQAAVVTTNIFEKYDGDWRMVLHHSSNFAEDSGEDEPEVIEFGPGGTGNSGDDKPN